MTSKEDCTLNDYLDLYKSGVPVPKLNDKLKSNQEFIAYSSKTTANPVVLVSYKQSFALIPYDAGMFEFYRENINPTKLFWMIPLELIDGTIRGFIIRSFDKKAYRTISFDTLPLPYGFSMFQGFKKNDPIILTEGTRDIMYVHNYVHPYGLSTNMGKVSKDLIHIISYLTNRVLIVGDMDKPGKELTKINIDLLFKAGIEADSVNYLLKDAGEYFSASQSMQATFINSIKNKLG